MEEIPSRLASGHSYSRGRKHRDALTLRIDRTTSPEMRTASALIASPHAVALSASDVP